MNETAEIGIFGGTGIYDSGLLKDSKEISARKTPKYFILILSIYYIELILNKFSTIEIASFFAKKTTVSFF